MKQEKFKVLLYLKKSSPDKSGKTPIMGRITLGNTMSQFSCKLSCDPKLWNPRESRLNGKSKIAVESNVKLDKLLLSINEAYKSLLTRKHIFQAENIKNMFQGDVATQMTLLKSFDNCIEEFKKRVGIDRSFKTTYKYYSARNCLADFIKKKFKSSDVAFRQLNEQFIREFQDFALLDKGYANGTVRHNLALLKKVCKKAYRDGDSDRDYFAYYRLPKQKESAPKSLSREQFEQFRDMEIPHTKPNHNLTRDMFIFSCYVGTAYVDVVSITKDNIVADDNGAMWLKFHRKKNNMLCRIKLLPEAIEIIEKYHDDNRDTIFPYILYATVSSNMRGFKAILGFTGALSYHMSRHSFSTLITLEQGVPLETVSRMLGHSDMKTTQIYARVTPKRLFEDMDKYIEMTQDLKLVL